MEGKGSDAAVRGRAEGRTGNECIMGWCSGLNFGNFEGNGKKCKEILVIFHDCATLLPLKSLRSEGTKRSIIYYTTSHFFIRVFIYANIYVFVPR